MTAKEYLQQIYLISRRIERLEQLRARIREDLYSVKSPASMDPDKVQSSISGDQLERLIARVDKIERDIVEEKNNLIIRRRNLQKAIECVKNDRYHKILFDRYVLCRKWEQIAEEMNTDLRWVFRLHGRALEEFKKHYFDH